MPSLRESRGGNSRKSLANNESHRRQIERNKKGGRSPLYQTSNGKLSSITRFGLAAVGAGNRIGPVDGGRINRARQRNHA